MHTRASNHLKIKGLQQRRVRHNLKKADPTIDSVSVLNESPDEYILYVAVPGMQRKDFAISIKGKKLIVSAGKKENLSPEFITELLNAIHKESLRIEDALKENK